MSLGRSVFYKERDWNDFHFYNGSTIPEITVVETPINHDYRQDVSTTYHSTYFDRILSSEERLKGLTFLQDRVYNMEFSVIKGFYKYTRNPMYVGMNSFLLGLLIILNNPINFTFLVIFFFIVRNLFVVKEEVQMEETFGVDYLTYKGKVRRWL